jgi:hypothetical protein
LGITINQVGLYYVLVLAWACFFVDWCRVLSHPNAMAASMMAVKLQEQLLAWERQLDSWEGTFMTQEDVLAWKGVHGMQC